MTRACDEPGGAADDAVPGGARGDTPSPQLARTGGEPLNFRIGAVGLVVIGLIWSAILFVYTWATFETPLWIGLRDSLGAIFITGFSREVILALVWVLAWGLAFIATPIWAAYSLFRRSKVPAEVARRVLSTYPVDEYEIGLADVLLATAAQPLPWFTALRKPDRQGDGRRYLVYSFNTSYDWLNRQRKDLIIEVPAFSDKHAHIDVLVRYDGLLCRPRKRPVAGS